MAVSAREPAGPVHIQPLANHVGHAVGPDSASEDPAQPHESARPLGRFSAFARRRRDRCAPVWRLTLAYLCSLLLHIAVAMDLVWVAASLSGAPSAEPEVAW